MTLQIYSISGAPRPWRVLLGLAFKGLSADIKLLQASKQEHKGSDFLAINSRGTVPVLVRDDILIRDSIASLAWLDRAYPERPLFGASPDEAAIIWQITTESCDYLRNATNDLLVPLLVQGRDLPAESTEERYAWNLAARELRAECDVLEAYLENQLFLCGDKPSAADAVVFPDLRLVERAIDTRKGAMSALGLANIDSEYPNLASWRKRIEGLPRVGDTMPPHWFNLERSV